MANRRFTHFVIFAEMRTGSNFLEQSINQFADLHCHGELFNPHFIGSANTKEYLGISLKGRENSPLDLITKIRHKDDAIIPGFRFFNDHDPRVLTACLKDENCGKVILTRNPLESFVSLKIAAKTGQWKLTDLKDKRSAQIRFRAPEFNKHLGAVQDFQLLLLDALQTSGQTAFYINYEDINSVDILNGLARFLGAAEEAKSLKSKLKKQNPAPLDSKVENFAEMKSALSQIDFLNLSRTPTFEPRRGAAVPGYFAGNTVPLLFMPLDGAPVGRVKNWIAEHDGVKPDGLMQDFNQKTLRQWRRRHDGYQSLTVVRHPMARIYQTFCDCIVNRQADGYEDMQSVLKENYGLNIPEHGNDTAGYDAGAHKSLFLSFLAFLEGNLAGQTRIKVDAAWASQSAIIQGINTVAPIGHIFREDRLEPSLRYIEETLGLAHRAIGGPTPGPPKFSLAEIYDAELEEKSRKLYQRDYLHFGYGDWCEPG